MQKRALFLAALTVSIFLIAALNYSFFRAPTLHARKSGVTEYDKVCIGPDAVSQLFWGRQQGADLCFHQKPPASVLNLKSQISTFYSNFSENIRESLDQNSLRFAYTLWHIQSVLAAKQHRVLTVGNSNHAPHYLARLYRISAEEEILTLSCGLEASSVPNDTVPCAISLGELEYATWPLTDSSIDVVLLLNIWQYLRVDPIFVLLEAHRVLAPDGLLLITTPNPASFWDISSLLKGGTTATRQRTSPHSFPARAWSYFELSDVVRQASFNVVQHLTFCLYREQPHENECLRLAALIQHYAYNITISGTEQLLSARKSANVSIRYQYRPPSQCTRVPANADRSQYASTHTSTPSSAATERNSILTATTDTDTDTDSGRVVHSISYKMNRWRSPFATHDGGRGTIGIFAVANEQFQATYKRTISLWRCYASMHNYSFELRAIAPERSTDPELFFEKLRGLIDMLPKFNYVLVIDVDMLPVNMSALIEELIDPRFEILFADREDPPGEVMAASYLLHHSSWTLEFLRGWLSFEQWCKANKLRNRDNGALHAHLLRVFFSFPNSWRWSINEHSNSSASAFAWASASSLPAEFGSTDFPCAVEFLQTTESWDHYDSAVRCFRRALSSRRLWLGRVKIMLPWMAWFRLWEDTSSEFESALYQSHIKDDFMYHVKATALDRLLGGAQTGPYEVCDMTAVRELRDRQLVIGSEITQLSTAQTRAFLLREAKRIATPEEGEYRYFYEVATCFPECYETALDSV